MSDCSNKGIINTTFIIDGLPDDNNCNGVNTNRIISCSGDTSIELSQNDLLVTGNIIPSSDDAYMAGSISRRFREVNTVNGRSTIWTSTSKIVTPEIDLGTDSENNVRIITANNSIIKNDTIFGGSY